MSKSDGLLYKGISDHYGRGLFPLPDMEGNMVSGGDFVYTVHNGPAVLCYVHEVCIDAPICRLQVVKCGKVSGVNFYTEVSNTIKQ